MQWQWCPNQRISLMEYKEVSQPRTGASSKVICSQSVI